MGIRKIPVLLYHKVGAAFKEDPLSITSRQFEEQLQLLQQKGYNTIHASELIAYHYTGAHLPQKPVLLSFDDGYHDNYLNLYPLLLQYRMKAVVFLVPSFIATASGSQEPSPYLTLSDLRKIDPAVIEFGLHAYRHDNYRHLPVPEITRDIEACRSFLDTHSIPFVPALAYPYGAYPKKNRQQYAAMRQALNGSGLRMAFRIGNRVNRLPLNDPFVVQRIDISGGDSISRFRRKLQYGGKYLLF